MKLALLLVLCGVAEAKPQRWEQLPMPPEAPAADAHGTVAADGAQIYWQSWGKGSPVILLHGGLGNADQWGAQLPIADHQVIAIDTRGHGRSTVGKKPFSYHLFAEDVIAVMDALKLDKAAVFGWSDGAEIALDLALHHADRIAKVFALAVNYDVRGSKPHGDHSDTFYKYAAKCHKDFNRLTTGRKWDALADAMSPVWRNPTIFTKDQIKQISVPVVIADGDHDEIIVLDQEKEMATLIPHAKLVVFEGSSHFVMWQDPDALGKAIATWLAEP